MIFGMIFPYLKGFHLTIYSHLPKRNEKGWKLKDLEWVGRLNALHLKDLLSRQELAEYPSTLNDQSCIVLLSMSQVSFNFFPRKKSP